MRCVEMGNILWLKNAGVMSLIFSVVFIRSESQIFDYRLLSFGDMIAFHHCICDL